MSERNFKNLGEFFRDYYPFFAQFRSIRIVTINPMDHYHMENFIFVAKRSICHIIMKFDIAFHLDLPSHEGKNLF